MKTDKIIIGSQALKHWFPDFNRIPKDTDYIVADKTKWKSSREEEYFENPVIFNNQDKYTKDGYITPNALYTLKISHVIGYDIFWSKNVWDVQYLKEQGCQVIPQLLEELIAYWEIVHGPVKRSDLEMSAESFFNNALKFPIYHDDLHLILIKHSYFEGEKLPTYSKILKEGAEVDVCMDKFEALSEKEKFNVVFEEVAAMALERFPRTMHYKMAYGRMLKKFILYHSKWQEAVWIVQNHKELLTKIPFNYRDFLWEQIDNQLKQQEYA